MKTKTTSLPWVCLLSLIVGIAFVVNGQGSDLAFNGLCDITVTTTSTTPVALSKMAINLVLGLSEATVQLDARIAGSTFDTLTLSAVGSLAGINLNSSLRLDPSVAEFVSWQFGASFTLFDLAFSNLTNIVSVQTKSYTQWSISGDTNDIDFQASFKFGTCPVEFWEASVCGNWAWFDCDANMSVCVQFDDAVGFRNITASMKDLLLFEDLWGIHGSFDSVITFTVDEKVFTPTLKLVPSWFFCSDIELLGGVNLDPPLGIGSMSFYGLRGRVEVGSGLAFTFAESLVAEKNSSVTGKADYWERFTISGPLSVCCGSQGGFEVNAYFKCTPAPSDALFGLGLVTGSFDFLLFENFSFILDVELPTASSDWELAWTFRILW